MEAEDGLLFGQGRRDVQDGNVLVVGVDDHGRCGPGFGPVGRTILPVLHNPTFVLGELEVVVVDMFPGGDISVRVVELAGHVGGDCSTI